MSDPESVTAVIISQDCDIVNSSYEAEPYVEILLFSTVPFIDGNLTYGKNARRIQVVLNRPNQVLESSIHTRRQIDRKLLENHSPGLDVDISQDTIDIIRRWVARRYSRDAHPDEFNTRCRPAIKKIRNTLKKYGGDFSGIYIRLNPLEELECEADYRLTLTGTVSPQVFYDPERMLSLYNIMDTIFEALDSCEGISVERADVVSEKNFTVDDLREVQRWDWDHLSLREEDGGDIAPSL